MAYISFTVRQAHRPEQSRETNDDTHRFMPCGNPRPSCRLRRSNRSRPIMKPAIATHEPLSLTGDTLNRLAWHIPDLVAYQHSADEWWFAPLDDNLPIIRLNRRGLAMLQAMNGHTTVGMLLEQFGQLVCGPDGQPGRWHLEHWALPTYSLCYYGTEPPGGHRHKAKWDLLLQQIREGWSGQEGFEGEEHLEDFHHHALTDSGVDDGHFDLIETTVSHLFREPN
ncbi:MAG TPA: hypothetical protein VJU02_00530, partial [Nitrospiraceae bacterium]|nr:hypothetical protein [Nitrospiraceae bacterium]